MVRRMLLATVVASAAVATQAWAGSWLVQGSAGAGIPAGGGRASFKTCLLIGGSVGYLTVPFEIGADVSWQKSTPDGDYRAELDAINAGVELWYLQYGVHARLTGPVSGKAYPFLGGGLSLLKVKDKYDSPTFAETVSTTNIDLHGDAGLNYWVAPSWGIGITGAYHFTLLDDETFPSRIYTSFYAITGGLLFKLGSNQ